MTFAAVNAMKQLSSAGIAMLFVAQLGAQAPAQPARPRPAAKPAPLIVTARDQSGTPLEGVRILVSGVASAEFATNASGAATIPNLKSGTYRLRFERDGFITLEHDVLIRVGQPNAVEVALDLAPPPPPPPPPPPSPPPSPPPPPPAESLSAAGLPVSLSIPTFLDKNFVGREPLKESVVACNGNETVRLLQLRDPLAEHTHADQDEIVYIVAGEGGIRVDRVTTGVAPGSLVVIPHGTAHAFERRGRNPLVVLSTLSGPCRSAAAAQR